MKKLLASVKNVTANQALPKGTCTESFEVLKKMNLQIINQAEEKKEKKMKKKLKYSKQAEVEGDTLVLEMI
jgi:O-phosphoseryl-tRNA(Cys) synthetase